MRLLNTRSLELEFFMSSSSTPDYVILSHRWGPEECSFEDVTKGSLADPDNPARLKQGFPKLQGACDLANRDGYMWIWIDTCCIDKSSSSELQEAINSMWKYYEESNICYAYISDVPDSEAGWNARFSESEWFTRGWTLQELIAPVCVEFYAKDWSPIGTKRERFIEIARITSIDQGVLMRSQEIDLFSAAQKLSWVAHRKVTREEDEAYSLLGLFDVNIPLLYGEGRERAFVRLQEAIFTSSADHTLFLFRYSLNDNDQPLLADSPTRFCDQTVCALCSVNDLRTVQSLPPSIPYSNIIASVKWHTQAHEQIMTTVTPRRNEMSTTLPLLTYQEVSHALVYLENAPRATDITHVAVLNHTLRNNYTGALCLLLRRGESLEAFCRVRSLPVLLPNLGLLEHKLQKTKVLICPGPSSLKKVNLICTTFSMNCKNFIAQEWSSNNCNEHIIEHWTTDISVNTRLKIQTSEKNQGDKIPQISCQIASIAGMILLEVTMKDKIWSIKKVFAMRGTTRPRKSQVLFHSSHLVDRCSISLPGGQRVSIRLRRLPAACRASSNDIILQYGYQIVVEFLQL